ncbi:BaiN/RdsA family NAD(P)/FAD-dependent oxidoreductase [Altererythrobacter lutimaris]|uniref:NAD(P)/FAD-dependent oxidoreductase n=1 Tax=Altererythrobacter lutimaris TaxID=2743979 RepID=A0A850HA16_9SPHN|nr:NAD(P)/FAD-dependent oxidoreductase [Altererythrobacter lutimaris]NVE94569.1 NAD(P)/FAD-dependent oxidoreductase [Altererythrobacter lutimaris]
MSNSFDAIVLGAGAAGLMCAARAGQRGKRVLVLEKAEKPGKKILISGGGRCNFTNIGAGPANYLSANPHFAKSALARYTARDFLDLVENYDIAWHEKTLGQLFCDGSAKQIVAMLLAECDKAKAAGGEVIVQCDADVESVSLENEVFTVSTTDQTYRSLAFVIASGGPSIPKMGATGFAYDLARQFGLQVVEPRPALVPLTLGGEEVLFREISGVSAPVVATVGKKSFLEAALFTHKGLSGPAILQASSYWKPGEPILINFTPDFPRDWLLERKRETPQASLRQILREFLSDRLADILADKLGISSELNNASDKALRAAEERLARWTFMPNGTEGFAKAEVTVGGISTSELSSKTMEAKNIPGLYAIGEAVDVTGWLGGYNFQWAWASGVAAGDAI